MDEISGAGQIPIPTGDEQLRIKRTQTLQSLLSVAPNITLKSLHIQGHPDKSREVLQTVLSAKSAGVLDVKGPPPTGGSATLSNARVTFNTNDEDKDHDTRVTVIVKNENNVTAALIDGFFGHFNDQSKSGPFEMEVRNPSILDQMDSGVVTIQITPNGHDTWRFNMDLDLIFSDNEHRGANSGNLELSQNQNEATFGLEGKMHA